MSNASPDSSLPYYCGKARQEEALKRCGLPYTIIRPTLVFGEGDILVNNIAWLLRRFPVFPNFGGGAYRLQPIFAEDLATLAVDSANEDRNATYDAAGPDVFTFRDFVQLMVEALQLQALLVPFPSQPGIFFGRLIGLFTGDILLTRDELRGLMDENLLSSETPRASYPFSRWVNEHHSKLGRNYASELKKHFTTTG